MAQAGFITSAASERNIIRALCTRGCREVNRDEMLRPTSRAIEVERQARSGRYAPPASAPQIEELQGTVEHGMRSGRDEVRSCPETPRDANGDHARRGGREHVDA